MKLRLAPVPELWFSTRRLLNSVAATQAVHSRLYSSLPVAELGPRPRPAALERPATAWGRAAALPLRPPRRRSPARGTHPLQQHGRGHGLLSCSFKAKNSSRSKLIGCDMGCQIRPRPDQGGRLWEHRPDRAKDGKSEDAGGHAFGRHGGREGLRPRRDVLELPGPPALHLDAFSSLRRGARGGFFGPFFFHQGRRGRGPSRSDEEGERGGQQQQQQEEGLLHRERQQARVARLDQQASVR